MKRVTKQNPFSSNNDYVNRFEVEEILGCAASTVYAQTRIGALPVAGVERKLNYYFRKDAEKLRTVVRPRLKARSNYVPPPELVLPNEPCIFIPIKDLESWVLKKAAEILQKKCAA